MCMRQCSFVSKHWPVAWNDRFELKAGHFIDTTISLAVSDVFSQYLLSMTTLSIRVFCHFAISGPSSRAKRFPFASRRLWLPVARRAPRRSRRLRCLAFAWRPALHSRSHARPVRCCLFFAVAVHAHHVRVNSFVHAPCSLTCCLSFALSRVLPTNRRLAQAARPTLRPCLARRSPLVAMRRGRWVSMTRPRPCAVRPCTPVR